MAALFSKKPLLNHISGMIDVGFHPYGPTLTLSGVLSTSKKVFLIDHFNLSVKTPFFPVSKKFDWFTLQPHAALQGQFNMIKTPAKFVLSPTNSYTYNIMFVDSYHYADMKTVMVNVVSSWQGLQEIEGAKKTTEQLFASFCNLPMTKELHSLLQTICYWKAGLYEIDICVATNNDIFTDQRHFELTDEDVSQLKQNASSIIASTCGQPSSNYNLASVPLNST